MNLLSLGEGGRFRNPHRLKSHSSVKQGWPPPLVQAAEAGHLPLVRLLLARGDAVDARDRSGRTALMQACTHGYSAVARLLLAHGASASAQTTPSRFTPLHMAIHSVEMRSRDEGQLVSRGDIRLIRLLIYKGADVNACDDFGNSILGYAIIHCRRDACRLLLAHGANINSQNRIGNTALINAVGYGYLSFVRLLLAAGADTTLRTRRGHSALWFARKRGYTKIVEALVAARAPE